MAKQPNTPRKWDEVDAVKAGRTLRRARQYANKSQQDIADEMRVELRVIDALENGDWRDLPGDTYAKGYMRRYAEIVDIAPPEASEPSRTNEQEAVSHVKRLAMGLRGTSLLMRRALVMAGIILSIALVTWSVLEETKQRVKLEIVKPVPQRLKELLIVKKEPKLEVMGPPKPIEEKLLVEPEPVVTPQIKVEIKPEPKVEVAPPVSKPIAIVKKPMEKAIEKPKAALPKELPKIDLYAKPKKLPRINIKPKAVKAVDDAYSPKPITPLKPIESPDDAYSPPPKPTTSAPSALDALIQNIQD